MTVILNHLFQLFQHLLPHIRCMFHGLFVEIAVLSQLNSRDTFNFPDFISKGMIVFRTIRNSFQWTKMTVL